MDAIYVGIDVSKDRLDGHIRPSGEDFVVTRDGKGLEELVERLHALAPTLIAVEATGGFETIVAAAVAGASLPLAVVNPAQVRHFAQAIGKRAKTDPIDAAGALVLLVAALGLGLGRLGPLGSQRGDHHPL